MVNYNNGKIYKIEPNCEYKDGDIYIGSTTEPKLSRRMYSHRSKYKKWLNKTHHYVTSFDIFEKYGVENCSIILLEKCECSSKDELQSKEACYIRLLKCVNKVIPQRSSKEYYEDNADHIKNYQKEYRVLNREILATQKKEYRALNKEKISTQKKEYRALNRDQMNEKKRQHYSENREELLEKQRAYRHKNKEQLNAKQRAYKLKRKLFLV